MIDSHCHLYLDDFDSDLELVMQRAIAIDIQKIFLPCIDSTVIERMLKLEEKYPSMCIPMMGIHPCSIKENFKEELNVVFEWLQKRKFAAVGEIGLDFYWDKTFKEQQFNAFEQQMQWALDFNLPIVIHSRDAMQATIDCVKPFAKKGLKGIFHCFTGSYESAKQIIDLGFLLGIGGVVTYKNAGLAEVLKKIDVEYLVLETDAPYLTPVPFRGKRNEPSYLQFVVKKIAEAKNVDENAVKQITTANAEKIFNPF